MAEICLLLHVFAWASGFSESEIVLLSLNYGFGTVRKMYADAYTGKCLQKCGVYIREQR